MKYKCSKQLHIDMPLYVGALSVKMRNTLYELALFQIYQDEQLNEALLHLLEVSYIQPIYHIYRTYLIKHTGHDIVIGGNGYQTFIEYKDTGAKFRFDIAEQGHIDVDFFYNENSTDDEAKKLIWLLESIFNEHWFFDLRESVEEIEEQRQSWLNEIIQRNLELGFDVTEGAEDYDKELPY